MLRKFELENATVEDIVERINMAVEEATAPLRSEVEELRDELMQHRRVVTHREAVKYFGYNIKPRRVKEFILAKNLPKGVDIPLPANRIGNTYFIDVDTLQDWQAGDGIEDDLYDWQTNR